MRIRVSDPALLRDLISYLRAAECVAEQASRDVVEAYVPRARDERQARRELDVLLSSWRAMHEGTTTEFLE
jgi:hypothetical protein